MKNHQLVMFVHDVQLFGSRVDSYSTERAEAAGVTWKNDDDGILFSRTTVNQGVKLTVHERIYRDNIRQHRMISEAPADAAPAKK